MNLSDDETQIVYNVLATVMRGFTTAPPPWAIQRLFDKFNHEALNGFQSETESHCGREESKSERLLSTRQVATMIGCSKQYVNRKAEAYGGNKVDGAWVFPESAILEHLEGRDDV